MQSKENEQSLIQQFRNLSSWLSGFDGDWHNQMKGVLFSNLSPNEEWTIRHSFPKWFETRNH